MDLYHLGVDVLSNPKHSRWVSNCLIVGEAVLCGLIIWKVPYTEIDWKTYMQQVSLFLDGERNYTLIKGDTGPLVYPAIHLYLYSGLYYLTDSGTNLLKAQCIFALLYLVCVAVVLACYRRVGAPPWLLLPLVLSKRLHSIFLLRLFNDAWAAFGLWMAIWAFQKKLWTVGGIAWCLALGVKMTLLLAAPAVGVILLQGHGTSEATVVGAFVTLLQLFSAMPFYMDSKYGYFYRAFDFGRQFLFKWTVNWRFVGEDVFSSREFAVGLLVIHVSLLFAFLQYRWIKPSSSSIWEFVRKYTRPMDYNTEQSFSKNVTPRFVMDSMLGSVAIGMLCARSLHYQFYAYLGWATPYLLWRSGIGPTFTLANLLLQEWAWLTYPSTTGSSISVVIHLAVAVACIWFAGTSKPQESARKNVAKTRSE